MGSGCRWAPRTNELPTSDVSGTLRVPFFPGGTRRVPDTIPRPVVRPSRLHNAGGTPAPQFAFGRPFGAAVLVAMLVLAPCGAYAASLQNTIQLVQPKIVKIYGAGGFRGMEGYQTGMLVSPTGHVLTAFSHVLDTEYITAVLADGRKFTAKLLGADPRLEIAVLKIDAADLPYFDLAKAVKVQAGEPILAFSNAFGVATGDEPASVQRGTVAVVAPLEARRGAFETPYHGPIYVLDSTTNNAGAAGGALVTRRGELVGMLGKELRNALNDTWLNYAVPVDALSRCVEDIRAGKFVARAMRRRPANRSGRSIWRCWGLRWCPTCCRGLRPMWTRFAPARRPIRRAFGPTI